MAKLKDFVFASVLLLLLVLTSLEAADNFSDQASDYEFVYHDRQKLLLAIQGDNCFYVSVAGVPSDMLTDAVGKLQLEVRVIHMIQNNVGSASTLVEMRDKYTDMLADFHCLNKKVFTLQFARGDGTFDCSDVKLMNPQAASEVTEHMYVTNSEGLRHNFSAFCDQTTDGGGWTVLLRRRDGSQDFYKNWENYEHGFGNRSGEYWLGLKPMYHLTNARRNYELRVDIGDWDGSTAYAVYNVFRVEGPSTNYVLHVTGYHGTAGDGLDKTQDPEIHSSNGMPFSAFDEDHDADDHNCCLHRHNGWWHRKCSAVGVTGIYHHEQGHHSDRGMTWYPWHNDWHRVYKSVDMKIRPVF